MGPAPPLGLHSPHLQLQHHPKSPWSWQPLAVPRAVSACAAQRKWWAEGPGSKELLFPHSRAITATEGAMPTDCSDETLLPSWDLIQNKESGQEFLRPEDCSWLQASPRPEQMKCPVLAVWLEGAINPELCIPRQCSARWSLLRKDAPEIFGASCHTRVLSALGEPWLTRAASAVPALGTLLGSSRAPAPGRCAPQPQHLCSREEPCKSQLIAVGWPLALPRSLPAFPAHFKAPAGRLCCSPEELQLGRGCFSHRTASLSQ